MSTPSLSAEQLEELRRYNSPTISNAIELFNVRPRHLGFLPHTIRSMFPEMGPIIGYAVTAQTRAQFAKDFGPSITDAYYRYVAAQPAPKIAVSEDLDDPPGLGAPFGEVNSTLHQKLGCVGHISNGCPRDLDEVRPLGFGLFGLNPCVSHAYVRYVDFGKPIKLGGIEIRPGDLLHADKHGVCVIPLEIAPRLAQACKAVEDIERPLLEEARSDKFDLERFIKLKDAAVAKMKNWAPDAKAGGVL
jgi:regulator of RNase E activity RraA